MITSNNETTIQYYGLSTDKKPTEFPCGNGSVFFEIDTQDAYMFNGETGQWVKL